MTMATKRFTRTIENFTCKNCGFEVKGNGYTDHCPNCLWSRHVDINPGDRAADCKGMMEPKEALHTGSGFAILFKCTDCKAEKRNRSAGEDNEALLFELMPKL
jgi:hypothetical protein